MAALFFFLGFLFLGFGEVRICHPFWTIPCSGGPGPYVWAHKLPSVFVSSPVAERPLPSLLPSFFRHRVCVASRRAVCSPANVEAAQLFRENMKEYVRRVKATVEQSWMDPDDMRRVEDEPGDDVGAVDGDVDGAGAGQGDGGSSAAVESMRN